MLGDVHGTGLVTSFLRHYGPLSCLDPWEYSKGWVWGNGFIGQIRQAVIGFGSRMNVLSAS